MSDPVPSLDEVIHGTYSKTRYRGKLDDFWLQVHARHVREGKPQTDCCAIALAGKEAVRKGYGFPASVRDVVVIGVSGAEEGRSTYPEIHFAATLNRTGQRILGKAVSRDFHALEIVSCNDLGKAETLACRMARHPSAIRFTDVRYTLARTGSYLPEDPERAFARELSNNAVRHAATPKEAVARVARLAPEYADRHQIPAERLPELTDQVMQLAASRAPGKRDKSGEAPKRAPARLSRSTTNRWTGTE